MDGAAAQDIKAQTNKSEQVHYAYFRRGIIVKEREGKSILY